MLRGELFVVVGALVEMTVKVVGAMEVEATVDSALITACVVSRNELEGFPEAIDTMSNIMKASKTHILNHIKQS
uniref:RNase H domain-containing protein n=1 Tax=Caenorhabditis tropicalis TaxID=1561998 RepID=A0A1I7UPV9_9PELO